MKGFTSFLALLVLSLLSLSAKAHTTSYVSSVRTRALYQQVVAIVTHLDNSTKIALPCGSVGTKEPVLSMLVVQYDNTLIVLIQKDLRASVNGWDGNFTLTVSAQQVAELDLLIPSDVTQLPVELYYDLVPVRVNCPTSTTRCQGKYCPFNVPSTEDPSFSFFSRIHADATQEVTLAFEKAFPSTLSTLVFIEEIEVPAFVPTFGSGLGIEVLDENGNLDWHCTITYDWLSTGSYTASVAPRDQECRQAAFAEKVKVWDSVIVALNASHVVRRTTSQTYGYVNLAHVTAASFDWASCRDLALSFFEKEIYLQNVVTDGCFTAPGTPEWNSDPCCNVELQSTQCCADRAYSVAQTKYDYTANSNSLSQTCSYPVCADIILRNYQNAISSSKFCTIESDKANNDPRFNSNPYLTCLAKIFGKKCILNGQCLEIPDSKCNAKTTTCVVPCSSDNPCFKGTCEYTAQFGNICVGGNEDYYTGLLPSFVDVQSPILSTDNDECMLGSIDPYLKTLIVDEVEQHDGRPFYVQFIERITSPTCLDPVTKLTPWLMPTKDTEEGCVNTPVKWCDWLVVPVPAGLYTVEDCNNPLPATEFCGMDLGSYVHIVFSIPNVCSVRLSDALDPDAQKLNSRAYCAELNPDFDWVGVINSNPLLYSACVEFEAQTESECYPDHCISNLSPTAPQIKCLSYCTLPIPQAFCTTQPIPPIGYRSWKTWTGPQTGQTYSACVNVGIPRSICLQNGGTWFQGMDWIPEFMNSPDTCTGICHAGISTFPSTQEACESEYTCTSCVLGTEASCFSQEECEKSWTCDNEGGCLLYPEIFSVIPNDVPCTFTPKACLAKFAKVNCDALSARRGYDQAHWQGRFTTEEECLSNSFICRLKGSPSNKTYVGSAELPAGFSLRNKTECEACGGTYESFFKWIPRKNVWVDLKWMKKQTLSPVWESQINEKAFLKLLEASRAERLANILSGELFCHYGTERELLMSLSCNCGEGGGCGHRRDIAVVLSGMSACKGVEGRIETKWITDAPLVFEVTSDFSVSSGEVCIKVKLLTVPLSLLQISETVTLSSLSITSESEIKSKLGSQFVYNDQDPAVVVGQIIGDGVGLDIDVEGIVDGFSVCLDFPEFDIETQWKLRISPMYKTIVVSDLQVTSFTILDLDLPLDTLQYCLDLSADSVFFPAMVIKQWPTIEIKDAWPSEEFSFSVALAVLYAILAIFTSSSLSLSAKLYMTHKKRMKSVPDLVALLFLVVLTICTIVVVVVVTHFLVRTIYFSGVPHGVWEGNLALVIIFGDLPALLFLGAVILTGLKWAEVYYKVDNKRVHKKKKRRLSAFSWGLIATIFILFVILSSIYGAAVNDEKHYNCENPPPEDLTYEESISLVYKCIFAFYSLITAIYFAYYGGNFLFIVAKFTSNKKERVDRLRKFLPVTALCVTALLALSAILIVSTTVIFDNMTKYAIIICVEWLPICFLCFFFGLQDMIMVKASDGSKSPKSPSTTRSTAKSSSSARSSKGGKSDSTK